MKVHSSILMILWGSYTGIHSSTWPSSSPRSRVQLSLHRWRQRCPPGWRGRSCSWCLWGSWVHHRHRRRTHSCHWSQATLEAAKSKFRITPSHCVIPSYSIMFHNIPWYFNGNSSSLNWKWNLVFSARFFSSITGFAAEWPFSVPAPKAFFWRAGCWNRWASSKKGIAYPSL